MPDGYVFLFKSAILFNPASTPADYQIYFVAAGGLFYLTIAIGSLTQAQPFSWQGWAALNAGDYIQIGLTAGQIDYWISGATLPFTP